MLQRAAEDFVTLSTKGRALTPYVRRVDGVLPQHNVLLGTWGSIILDCGQATTKPTSAGLETERQIKRESKREREREEEREGSGANA